MSGGGTERSNMEGETQYCLPGRQKGQSVAGLHKPPSPFPLTSIAVVHHDVEVAGT